MIRIVKMSLMLGLGLSLSNPLVAMEHTLAQEEDSAIVLETLNQFTAVIKKMNDTAVAASKAKATEFDAATAGANEIREVFNATFRDTHQYIGEYKTALAKLPQALGQEISEKLTVIRKKHLGDLIRFANLNDFLKAFEAMRDEKQALLTNLLANLKEALPPQRTLSKFELAWERDLDQQT